MEKQTVLSLEQALSLSYGTQRFVQLGWRVIRIEATPAHGRLPGDPNRYVGKETEQPDVHSYFIGPNVGKEAISLNLKQKAGQEILQRLLVELPAQIFASNTMPKRYEELGIDYHTLSSAKPDLIWVGLSAMGPDYPDAPGYDPAIQALTGLMDLTGDPQGPPTLCGVPLVDLKAGDEVFANVCLALAEKAHTGKGKRIDVSMTHAAASWLQTTIPLLDMGHHAHEVRRSGNEHREFVPVNVYPAADGYVYLAVGNDVQWARLLALGAFAHLAAPTRETNEGRCRERDTIHRQIGAVTGGIETHRLVELLGNAGLVAAAIHTVPEVVEVPAVRDALLNTTDPSGKTVRLPPPAVEQDHLRVCDRALPYPPAYGRDTDAILEEAGYSKRQIADFREGGIVA